ncbi:MAG: hypothetical protein J5850_01130 [Clostridia bacterium]|nr:hypothetical protein [Clostridia bacterium]
MRVIIQIIAEKNTKLWVNGKCLAVHHYNWLHTYYVTSNLKKGKNVILIEQYSPRNGALLSVQIRDYQFEHSNDPCALSNLGNAIQINPLTLISDPVFLVKDPIFKFMYFKNENIEYEDEFRIDIIDSVSGFVKRLYGKINESVEIDVNEIRDLSEESLRYEWIGCTFRKKNGNDFITAVCVFLKDFLKEASSVGDESVALAKELNQELSYNLLGMVRQQKLYSNCGDYGNLFWLTEKIKNTTGQIESGRYASDLYSIPGKNEYYIHSELDNSLVKVQAFVPDEYDKKLKYPLILALSTGNDGSFCCGPIEENLSEPCLCFDVTGRGFTGGSYIGEASTFEILRWISNHFSIDKERIYLLGQSNGGYASYSIAQNHPHLVAAIFPHISNPDFNTINNLSNVPVYQTVSNKDFVFSGHENEVKRSLGKYGNYHQLDFSNMTHLSFAPYLFHKGILRDLLSNRKNRFPKRIIFKTFRNRYLESFWIKIHGINQGKKFAEIRAEISDSRTISISLKNTNCLTITLPPEINREKFAIRINRKEIVVSNFSAKVINLRKKRTWEICDNATEYDLRKGTGLLDVYLNKMHIILPEGADDKLRQIASNFQSPFSNGLDPVIHVHYPIYEDTRVPAHIMSCNLILIDVNKTNIFVNRFYDKLKIKYDQSGYEYNAIRVEKSYLILQVIPNPYDTAHTFLIISANDYNLLDSFIVRKVIIPYYSSGIHPFWNSEAIIFDGKKYKRIYEYGGPIEDIY